MDIIIDSSMTFKDALLGTKAPDEIIKTLSLINIDHISFDKKIHRGQLLVYCDIADELREIFKQLLVWSFPIAKAVPLSKYNWSDENSMADNNSSAFNYRVIYGTDELSNHSFGLALDINPVQNPYIAIDGKVFPDDAVYDLKKPGTLVEGDKVVSLFESRGWNWGGKGVKVGKTELKDWQHFQKIK
jgi:hypothetical protein